VVSPLIIWCVVLLASIAVLVKAADYFTDAAEQIGKFFRLPPFIIGVTIVAIGTSLPELVSSIFAVLRGASEIVVGNVVGSNIANIFLVLGITAIVGQKLKIAHELIHVDLPLLVGSTFLFTLMIWDGAFVIGEAILCLVFLLVYILYTISSRERHGDKNIKRELAGELRDRKLGWAPVILIASAAFIYLGAQYTIDSVIRLADILKIGTETIALSAVALGTSLPELMVSISAVRKGKAEIAVGNILGSNIFNVLAVMAIPAFIGTLIIPVSILTFALPMLLMGTLLYFFITQDREITKWEGWLLVLFYVFFIGKLIKLF